MPPDAIGLPGTLYLYRDRVRIVAGRFSAEHVRQFAAGDRLDPAGASRATRGRGVGQTRAPVSAAAASARSRGRRPWRISPSSPIDGRATGFRRRALHALLQTTGDAALRARLRTRPRRAGDRRRVHRALSRRDDRPPCRSTDRRPAADDSGLVLPRAGRVQGAEGARRGGAQRSPWTRPSTAVASRRVGGRS